MTLQVLKNNLKIKYFSLIFLILTAIVALNYFITYQENLELASLLSSNAMDVNISNVKEIIKATNGLTYFLNFLLSSDFFVIFILIFSISSVFLFGRNIIDDVKNGRGNLIISRIGYKKYLESNILAQTIFNFTFLIIYFSILFFCSYLLNGNYDLSHGVITRRDIRQYDSIIQYYLIIVVKIISVGIIVNLLTVSATLINTYIKNKYIIQLFPLIVYIVTITIGSTIGNILTNYQQGIATFILDAQISYIIDIFFVKNSNHLIEIIVFLTISNILILALYKKNIKKFEREYLL